LPKLGFRPDRPSEYRIRKEPRHDFVSTIEALAHVLGVLEGDRARFEPMLVPFRRMVDLQLEHKQANRGAPSRYRRASSTVRRSVPGVRAPLHRRAPQDPDPT
jgi:DTW domain-containing protein YfiP